MIDGNKTLLSTRYNIQKIYLNDSVTITVPLTTSPTEFLLTTHSLGYIPTARVFYEPIAGQLWPLSREQYSAGGGGSGTTVTVIGEPVLTTTSLYVRLTYIGVEKDVKFYYRIYIDE